MSSLNLLNNNINSFKSNPTEISTQPAEIDNIQEMSEESERKRKFDHFRKCPDNDLIKLECDSDSYDSYECKISKIKSEMDTLKNKLNLSRNF